MPWLVNSLYRFPELFFRRASAQKDATCIKKDKGQEQGQNKDLSLAKVIDAGTNIKSIKMGVQDIRSKDPNRLWDS